MTRTAVIAGFGPGTGESLAWAFTTEGREVALFARLTSPTSTQSGRGSRPSATPSAGSTSPSTTPAPRRGPGCSIRASTTSSRRGRSTPAGWRWTPPRRESASPTSRPTARLTGRARATLRPGDRHLPRPRWGGRDVLAPGRTERPQYTAVRDSHHKRAAEHRTSVDRRDANSALRAFLVVPTLFRPA